MREKMTNRPSLKPLILTASSVFVAEWLSTGIVHTMSLSSKFAATVVNSLFLLILLVPVFYFLVFRLLSRHIDERRLAEEALRQAREKQYEIVTTTTMDAFWVLDDQGHILDVNTAICRMLGYSRDGLLAMSLFDVLVEDDFRELEYARNEILKHGFTRFETIFHPKNGEAIDVEISAAYSSSDSRAYVFLRDISPLKKNERQLIKAKEHLETEVDRRTTELRKANEELAARSRQIEMQNGKISAVNKMGELLSSCETSEEAYSVVAKSASLLYPRDAGALYVLNSSGNLLVPASSWGLDERLHKEVDPQSCRALRRGHCYSAEDLAAGLSCPHLAEAGRGHFCMPLTAHNEILGVLSLFLGDSRAEGQDGPGEERIFRLFSDVAGKAEIALANLRLSETLRNLSLRDPLSGLYNRRFMEEAMEREHARALREGASIGVLMFDIDHFKRFNDTFGHDAGDSVIRELGKLIRGHVRGSDIACRYGGEEFTVILPGADTEVAAARAEELRSAAAALQLRHDHQTLGPITLSLGVAVFPEHADSIRAALQAADEALYRAKNSGRNRVVIHAGPGECEG